MRKYFEKVAAHHGLEYKVNEYIMAEDPGRLNDYDHDSDDDGATFYVTNMREPVSISKYIVSYIVCMQKKHVLIL